MDWSITQNKLLSYLPYQHWLYTILATETIQNPENLLSNISERKERTHGMEVGGWETDGRLKAGKRSTTTPTVVAGTGSLTASVVAGNGVANRD